MKTILVAVSGMSPAIITETIWALATEAQPVIPDEVVVITTTKGEADIKTQLLTPQEEWGSKNVWETLRGDVLAKAQLPKKCRKLQLSVRVIELADETTGVRIRAADLRTRFHNEEAAEFILQTLIPYVDAEDNHVIASIAGGRKTMGALLYATMSLVAKETDRITHVLVNEPFDTTRGFFYPDQPHQNLQAFDPKLKGTSPVGANNAILDIADIPFVPLRNGFAELNEKRRTFEGLIQRYSQELKHTRKGPPKVILLDEKAGKFEIEQRPIELTGRNLLVAWFLLERAQEGKAHFKNREEAAKEACVWHEVWKAKHRWHQADTRMSGLLSEDDITKGLSFLRSKLLEKGLQDCIPFLAPERKRIGFEIAEC